MTLSELEPDVRDAYDAARAIIPLWQESKDGGKRGDYLAYRLTGFSVREAVEAAGTSETMVRRWRQEDPFLEMEKSVSDMTKRQSRHIVIYLLYIRNFRTVLDMDYGIMMKIKNYMTSLVNPNIDAKDRPKPPSNYELTYLTKARSSYSPEGMKAVNALLNGDKELDGGTWEELIAKVQTADGAETTVGIRRGINGATP
tara:strand:+ start:850 stop:1446 length:597 start_codon:yes stop_codon:yes gene_type:complete